MPRKGEYWLLRSEGRCVNCGKRGPHIGLRGQAVVRCAECAIRHHRHCCQAGRPCRERKR